LTRHIYSYRFDEKGCLKGDRRILDGLLQFVIGSNGYKREKEILKKAIKWLFKCIVFIIIADDLVWVV
jgi:hypothetical protein